MTPVVGLTGGIASGKSTVVNFFKELGAYVIDWDVLAREVVCPHLRAWREIVEYFSKEVLNEDLSINRARLAKMVFGDREKLDKLNEMTHPRIIEEDARMAEEIRRADPSALIIKDVPLLIEIGFHKRVDKVVVVYASEENRLRRLEEKGFSREDALSRVRAQLPLSEKIKLADFVIYNDGSFKETKKQVEKVYNLLMKGDNYAGKG